MEGRRMDKAFLFLLLPSVVRITSQVSSPSSADSTNIRFLFLTGSSTQRTSLWCPLSCYTRKAAPFVCHQGVPSPSFRFLTTLVNSSCLWENKTFQSSMLKKGEGEILQDKEYKLEFCFCHFLKKALFWIWKKLENLLPLQP